MSDSGNANLDPKFAHLEQLPIETLEDLLRKSASLPETEGHDAYVDALVEVIIRKEQEHPTDRLMDSEKSWEQFQSVFDAAEEDGSLWNFNGSEDPTAFMDLPKKDAVPPDDVSRSEVRRKHRKGRRFYVPVAAIVLLLSMFVMQVSGVPLLQTLERFFSQMTGEVFRYSPEDKPEGCVQLEETMRELGMLSDFAITWHPERFEPDPVLTQKNDDWTMLYQRYSNTDGFHFSLVINWYEDVSRISDSTNMKDESGEAADIYRGIRYWVLPNEDETAITWYCGHYSGTISGNLREDELIDIFRSMGGIDS